MSDIYSNNPLFYQFEVIDNQDPVMLGRVRARRLTQNYQDVINQVTNPPWNEEKDKWTSRDPFIINPLLPYYINQVPQPHELINVIYNTLDNLFLDRYYVQSLISSPTLGPFEYYQGAKKFSGVGLQFSNPLEIKNRTDGSYPNDFVKGVFPEPGDNSILGRGSADIIVQKDTVVLRAGKTVDPLQPNVLPVANSKRSFVQLSRFENIKTYNKTETFTEKLDKTVMVKHLIEYFIVNPENTQSAFTGTIYVYSLKPDKKVNSKNLNVNSNIEEFLSPVYVKQFRALNLPDTIKFINDFINTCNSQSSIDGTPIFNDNTNKFPIYYRPTPAMYGKMMEGPGFNTTDTEKQHLREIFDGVLLNNSAGQRGFGLIYKKDTVGYPSDFLSSDIDIYNYTQTPYTLGSLGGDKVFLLSTSSSIPGKQKINFDGTVYGFTSDDVVDKLIPNTSSMVRGEELLDLLRLITRYLISHTHQYPGLPPTNKTEDGSSVENLLSALQNATNTILNKDIRLN